MRLEEEKAATLDQTQVDIQTNGGEVGSARGGGASDVQLVRLCQRV